MFGFRESRWFSCSVHPNLLPILLSISYYSDHYPINYVPNYEMKLSQNMYFIPTDQIEVVSLKNIYICLSQTSKMLNLLK